MDIAGYSVSRAESFEDGYESSKTRLLAAPRAGREPTRFSLVNYFRTSSEESVRIKTIPVTAV